LHIVQSAVSATIASLERELETPLLLRTTRQISLTDAGQQLLPKARATLEAARDARDAVHEVTGGIRGTLRIGTMSSLGLIDLPALVGQFHREHPAVSVRLALVGSGSPGLVAALTEGRLDLAFVSIPGSRPAGVRLRNLASTPLDLVVPRDHPLASRSEVEISELADESFVDFPLGYGNRAVTDRAFSAVGIQRRVTIEITDITAGREFVRQRLGVALLPRVALPPDDDLTTLSVTFQQLVERYRASSAQPGKVTGENERPKLTTIATLPEHYFLESIVVRADGSILVTALNRKELWWVPAPEQAATLGPILVDLPMSIVETEPDVFYVSSMAPAALDCFDLRGWTPSAPVNRTRVLTFESHAAGLIWRVDLSEDGLAGTATVWLRHESMTPGTDPEQAVHLTQTFSIPYPGVNGVRSAEKAGYVYFTGSWVQIFMRVAVDPVTHEPIGEPELVAKGIHAVDDFCLDENAGVAYITTHIDNTLHRVPLDPTAPAPAAAIVVGDSIDHRFLGPSSAAWGRGAGGYGCVAYFSTDGGHTPPNPAGIVKPASVVRVEF
jgi:DNA-binding transcriptional LysR family regulator